MTEPEIPELSLPGENEPGQVHIYTGEGKGKTTAALGLALRAVGAGLPVYLGQFMKGRNFSELKALKSLPGVTVEQYGDTGWIYQGKVTEEQYQLAKQGLQKAREALACGRHRLVILDELVMTLWFELLSKEDILELLRSRPEGVELVLTGRRAPEWLIAEVGLVTEMKEVRHYYHDGIPARRGIEH